MTALAFFLHFSHNINYLFLYLFQSLKKSIIITHHYVLTYTNFNILTEY